MGLLGTQFGNAVAAQTSKISRPVRAFVSQPEPRSIGLPSRGIHLLSGNFLFAGDHVEAPDTAIWDITMPSAAFVEEVQGFGWLDHLAAEGSSNSRVTAQAWLQDWIGRYGAGRGPGWTPQLTGRRVVRWINHGLMLLQNQSSEDSRAYFRSLGHQAGFLARRWKAAPAGLPRFEALTGLVYCGLALETRRSYLTLALRAIGSECEANIGKDGAIESRNPEELMTVFMLLTWASLAITEAGETPHRQHLLAMERMVPTLRSLRLGNGGLTQFHGGGRGADGQLDRALADSAIRLDAHQKGGMGFERMAHAGTTLLLDAGKQQFSDLGYASPLAFEMSSGRHVLFSNSGPGQYFNAEMLAFSREMYGHTGLNIAGQSPRLKPRKRKQADVSLPLVERSENFDFEMLVSNHSYYGPTHGLTHFRTLEMAKTGQLLRGKDRVVSDTDEQRAVFDKWFKKTGKRTMPIFAHFHVPPEVELEVGMKNTAVSMTLPNQEVWVLQAKGSKLAVSSSYAMDKGRLRPRAAKQIVLSDKAINYEGSIDWTVTRA